MKICKNILRSRNDKTPQIPNDFNKIPKKRKKNNLDFFLQKYCVHFDDISYNETDFLNKL